MRVWIVTQDNGFFDQGPMNVSGAITARRARVIYKDGMLYVFTTPTRAQSMATTEPVQSGQDWTVQTEEDGTVIHFTRRGCSTCGWNLGRFSAPDLLAKV